MNLVAQKVLYVLSIGIVNILTGKTMYDWSIYDHVGGHVPTVSLTRNGSLLYGGGGEIGADIELRGNDSQRLLGKDQIVDNCPSTKDEVLAMPESAGALHGTGGLSRSSPTPPS